MFSPHLSVKADILVWCRPAVVCIISLSYRAEFQVATNIWYTDTWLLIADLTPRFCYDLDEFLNLPFLQSLAFAFYNKQVCLKIISQMVMIPFLPSHALTLWVSSSSRVEWSYSLMLFLSRKVIAVWQRKTTQIINIQTGKKEKYIIQCEKYFPLWSH